MCLDPGGIGKGLAADMVAGHLIAAGADGASVSIGGDVAVAAQRRSDGGWLVGVADPMRSRRRGAAADDGRAAASQLRAPCAAAGTATDGEPLHHLLDPATGRPAHHAREIVAVTVVAGTAAWAEVWTKAVMVRGAAMLGRSRRARSRCPGDVLGSVDDHQLVVVDVRRSGEQRGDLVGDEVEMVEV